MQHTDTGGWGATEHHEDTGWRKQKLASPLIVSRMYIKLYLIWQSNIPHQEKAETGFLTLIKIL